MSSLINRHHDNGDFMGMRRIEWKRATDIFEEPKIFTDGIHPNDIN